MKDLWFSEVPKKGPDGKTVRDAHGRVVTERRKTAKHPDRGGSKDARRWLACWIDPDGDEKTKAYHKREDAKAYAKKMQADADRGEYIDPDAGREKLGPLFRKYLRLRAVGANSRKRYGSVYRNHVEAEFAHRAVKAPRPSDIVEWLRGPVAKMSESVQATAYMIVAGTFDLAVADNLRRDNPARSPIVPKPRAEPKEKAAWPAERVWKVRDAHPGRYRALVDCTAGLSLRRGCAFGLAVEDFDFEGGKVTVRRQVSHQDGRWVFKLPKFGKERTVPLPRGVAASVRAHMAQYPPVACTLPWMDEDGTLGDPVTVRLLFVWEGDDPRTHGQPIREGSYDQGVWLPALSAAGIIPPPVKDGYGNYRHKGGAGRENGMHALRHFYETALDDGGVSLAGMMEFMGHSRKGQPITIGVYGHVSEETFERARNAIDQRLFRLRPVGSAGTVAELRRAR